MSKRIPQRAPSTKAITDTNYKAWRKHSDCFRYDVVENVYEWATTFRAGIIGICKGKLLIVRECDRRMTDKIMGNRDPARTANKYRRNGDVYIEGNYGFPKGGRSSKDVSLCDTALREFREEVGIELDCSQLKFPACTIERKSVHELIVFFFVKFDEEPKIKLKEGEIVWHGWLTLDDARRIKGNVSKPTQDILSMLYYCDDINVKQSA